MNGVFINLDSEIAARINVEKTGNNVAFSFGYHADMFMTKKQAEELFKKLDKQLHEETMQVEYLNNEISQLEDKLFTVDDNLEKANDQIEMYKDQYVLN